MSKFFINRPIVAMVISIVMVLVGSLTVLTLPVAQFPNITPPEIQVIGTYVGADAQTLEQAVATPIEQQVLDTANAQIPDLERQIAQEEDAISILLGDYPKDIARGIPLVDQTLPPEVPPGVPSSIIERRPDIREAEQILIAANADIGVAKARFFPQISLTGGGGGSFGRDSVFPGSYNTQLGIWSYGAQVSQPIFTGGALKGNLHLAESEHKQALIAYQQAAQLENCHPAGVWGRLRCTHRL
jgi:outer membrane protein TolC